MFSKISFCFVLLAVAAVMASPVRQEDVGQMSPMDYSNRVHDVIRPVPQVPEYYADLVEIERFVDEAAEMIQEENENDKFPSLRELGEEIKTESQKLKKKVVEKLTSAWNAIKKAVGNVVNKEKQVVQDAIEAFKAAKKEFLEVLERARKERNA